MSKKFLYSDPTYDKRLGKPQLSKLLNFLMFVGFLNVAAYAIFLLHHHYLPAPFVFDKNNVFMDFYNPIFEQINGNFYASYNSVYPPVNYYILKIFSYGMETHNLQDAFGLRLINSITTGVVIFLYTLIVFLVSNLGEWRKFSQSCRIKIFIIAMFSMPILFAFERGNLIFVALLFLALYLNAQSYFLRALFLSILINIKPYFLVFLIPYFNRYEFNWRFLVGTISISIALFMVTSIGSGINFLNYFITLLGFSEGQHLSPYGVLALPNSLGAFLMPRWASTQFWYYPVKLLSVATPALLFFYLIFGRLNKTELLIGCFFLLANISVATGGYIFIIYLVLIPYLIESEVAYKKFLPALALIFCLPIDWIPVFRVELPSMYSYLGGQFLIDASFDVGLGSILRPLFNYYLMAAFIYFMFKKYSANDI